MLQPQPCMHERPSLVTLTWGQVQLVECLELLSQVPMVHPACRGRPVRRHAGYRAPKPQGQSTLEHLPFQWVLVCPSSYPDSLLERSLEQAPGLPLSLGFPLLRLCGPTLCSPGLREGWRRRRPH